MLASKRAQEYRLTKEAEAAAAEEERLSQEADEAAAEEERLMEMLAAMSAKKERLRQEAEAQAAEEERLKEEAEEEKQRREDEEAAAEEERLRLEAVAAAEREARAVEAERLRLAAETAMAAAEEMRQSYEAAMAAYEIQRQEAKQASWSIDHTGAEPEEEPVEEEPVQEEVVEEEPKEEPVAEPESEEVAEPEPVEERPEETQDQAEVDALLISRASATKLRASDRPSRRKALESPLDEDDDLLAMIAEMRRERLELSRVSAEQEANASQGAKDLWAAREAEEKAERQRIGDEKREAAELAATRKRVNAEQKEDSLKAMLERTKRLKRTYGDDYVSIRLREDEAIKEAKLEEQRYKSQRAASTSSSRYSPSSRSSSRSSSRLPTRSTSTFASNSMLMSDEFDLQTLLDEQAAENERQDLNMKLGKFDFNSAFDRIGDTIKEEEKERKAQEEKEAEENKYASYSSSRTKRDSKGVRVRSDDDYVFMTSHKAGINKMNSYEAMQELIGNSEEDDIVSTKYSAEPASEGIDWQARLGQRKGSRFTSSRSSSRSTPKSSSSRSSRRSSLWDDEPAEEEISDDVFNVDWSAFGSSLFSF